MILKTLKNDLEEDILIGLSISFMLGKKYFLYRHNSKRYLGGLTYMNHPVHILCYYKYIYCIKCNIYMFLNIFSIIYLYYLLLYYYFIYYYIIKMFLKQLYIYN